MKYALAAALLVSLSAGVSAQAPQGPVEARAQMNAAGEKGDKAAYGKFLSDDFTWVDRAGRLRNKTAMVEEVAPATGTPPSPTTPEMRSYGNTAVLIGTRRNPDGIQVRYIQAWVKNGNGWQVVAHQAVPASGDQPGSPATIASSALPASLGPQAERDAVQKNTGAIGEAIRKGDGIMWAGLVTSQFISISGTGAVKNKQERTKEVTTAGPQPNFASSAPRETSIRIHGNLAVANHRLGGNPQPGSAPGSESWQTVVTIKDGGQWRRAAVITTPITGAARPKTH